MNDAALYTLGYKIFPSKFPNIEWKMEWFPAWFWKIENGFSKLVLPPVNLRLELLLHQERMRRIPIKGFEYFLEKEWDDLKAQNEALKTRGVHAILNGECSATITNVMWYGATPVGENNGRRFVWGHVYSTDNYGKPTYRAPINEFDDYDTKKRIRDYLDTQILMWYHSDGIFKDTLDKIVNECWQKI